MRKKLRGAPRERLRYVGLHELGHVPGLCHESDAISSLTGRNAPSPGYEINWIPDVDKADHEKLWG
ncbi:hypothetical protein [Streptomyces sp. NRRL F-5727]|uniref:hypothetical protein n=1 Tax=Streptomyces sp. NRRL F-5727 TaxID=1463871 RepID=UPI0004CB9735|nr:hypothetical protein [Streptomyces sp. NRRL F-5727]